MVLTQSKRVLSFHSEFAGVVLFTNEDADTPVDEATHFRVNQRDWADMGNPRQITLTITPGDVLNA